VSVVRFVKILFVETFIMVNIVETWVGRTKQLISLADSLDSCVFAREMRNQDISHTKKNGKGVSLTVFESRTGSPDDLQSNWLKLMA
jgi:hypothetical protein